MKVYTVITARNSEFKFEGVYHDYKTAYGCHVNIVGWEIFWRNSNNMEFVLRNEKAPGNSHYVYIYESEVI